jgi:hypothetical protein
MREGAFTERGVAYPGERRQEDPVAQAHIADGKRFSQLASFIA